MARNKQKQAQLIAAIMSGLSVRDAAAQVGVNYQTARIWHIDPDFKQQLADARKLLIADALDKQLSIARTASEVIAAILGDPSVPPSVRLKAAEGVLDRVTTWLELSDLDARLTIIEERHAAEQEAG